MAEEQKDIEVKPAEAASTAPAAEQPAEASTETVPTSGAATETVPATDASPAAEEKSEPEVIIQTERGFAHYVGFALLCVLCVCFFFMPGIALTFGVSQLVSLNGAAAWIFSAILSVIIWLIFKLKIKGFKKSFYWYVAFCVVVLAILIGIEVATEKFNVFASIFALLTGANA